MRLIGLVILSPLFLTVDPHAAHADTAMALCSITPKGETAEPATRACSFSQRQGYVNIAWTDDEENFIELSPIDDDTPGNYTDETGKPAYRKSGLGDKGLMFDTRLGTVRVYW